MDATKLKLPDASIDVLCADLPWGQLPGSHETNATLYPQVLAEAGRVAAPQARAIFITHEIRLMERVLRDCAALWTLQQEVKVFQGGLHPRDLSARAARLKQQAHSPASRAAFHMASSCARLCASSGRPAARARSSM